MSEAAGKLREAKALIEPRGAWMQGDFEVVRDNGTRSYCMAGALLEVCNGKIPDTVRGPLRQALGGRSIYSFNDAEWRKKKDVLSAFDKAIELAETTP
jgi:hypothetical protein